MKASVTVLLGLLSLASLGAADCHGDNCARAVTGTGPHKTVDITSRRSDCSSFMRTTVTPEPFIATVTETVYTDSPPRPARSTSLATSSPATTSSATVPGYASACVNAGEYSSACSCWGITTTVTTLPRSTITATTTTYVNVGCKMPAYCPMEKVNKYRCGRRGWCTCLREAVVNGQRPQSLCVRDALCAEVKECRTSRDCDKGQGCVVNHCCEERGPRICLVYAPRACENASRPRAIFERRAGALSLASEGGSEKCTAFGCGQV
ncbi:hypothetical protein CMUS01_06356 [Colletotrichum musicola]|uniref:Uncharacterized protein n=1 Tax=Colletotrichum musicola TaxID=2175873 RepID=A0A8H6KMD1_9PEZI|nr:hypothetical protein CMUS01_06356 [Colletotrichum musicola]